jgi:phosphonate transport system ATP-binding protein
MQRADGALLFKRERRDFQSKVGQVLQGLHLVQRLTVIENVLLRSLVRNRSWLTWARIFPSREIMRAEAALQAVGLIGKAGMRVDRLSGGERQKTGIARMLMQAPQLILADEPTAALDPLASSDIAAMLVTVARQQGMTLELIS